RALPGAGPGLPPGGLGRPAAQGRGGALRRGGRLRHRFPRRRRDLRTRIGATMNTDVLIAVAGPTGLALAVDLARRVVDALVVEASPEPLRQSRGKGLQPRSLEVLDDLGVAGEVLAAGAWRQDITLYKDGRRLARLGAGSAEPRPDLPYPNIVMIPQWRLTAILRDRLSALGGRLLPGARLLRLSSG